MGKKIKISEDQLVRLMENKSKQMNENEEINEIGLGLIEWSVANEIAPIVMDKLKAEGHDLSYFNPKWFTRALEEELNKHMKHSVHDEKEEHMGDMDEMDLETGGAEDLGFPESEMQADEMMNESVKGYRMEFDRFMKGPKI